MAPAVITKAAKQDIIAEIAPLLRKQITADVLKATKRPPVPKVKSTTISHDIPIELLERMIRVEEELKLVHVEIKHLHTEMNQLRKDFSVQFDRIDKRFNSTQWFMGVIFVAITTLITVYQFLS